MTLILIAMGWLAGLVATGVLDARWWMGAAWTAAVAPVLVLRAGLDWRLAGTMVAAAGIAGALLSNARPLEPPPLVQHLGEKVTVVGRVASEPDPGRVSTGYEIEVDELITAAGTIPQAGRIRATLHQYADYLPGDRLRLEGKLELPPVFDGFDYRSYLRQRNVWATMLFPSTELVSKGDGSPGRSLSQLRLRLDDSLQRVLPEPEASLGAGIAFGRDGNLSMERKEAYNRSGLRHLVAVSGSNVSLVAGMTVALAVPLMGRKFAWIPAAVTISVYLLVAGFSPSVVRAGIMAWILLIGGIIGRPQSGVPALGAALIVMTALDPRNALQPGFQLSMAATAGLLTVSPWLTHWFEHATARFSIFTPPRWVCEITALSVAASVATAPIMWFHFGELSLVGPLANVLVQPALLVAFWASLLTAVSGLASPTLAWWLSLATYYPLAFIDNVASIAAGLPLSTARTGNAPATAATLAMLPPFIIAAVAYRFLPPSPVPRANVERQRAIARRWVSAATAGAFFFAAIPISLLPVRDSGELRVDFLNIGQGDAILVTTPAGKQILVDGGPSGIVLARQLSGVMPHWDRSLDLVILSHPQEDHLGGLPELFDRFEVAEVAWTGHENRSLTYRAFHERLDGSRRVLSAGDSFEFDGLVVDVLWPLAGVSRSNLNDLSVVLRLTFGEVVLLLSGDIEAPAQRQLMSETSVRADVLKVPHHGSKTSAPEFLAAVGASVAVIQAGEGNRFGHPHDEVIGALAGVRLLRNDEDGRVTLTTDGRTIRVRTER